VVAGTARFGRPLPKIAWIVWLLDQTKLLNSNMAELENLFVVAFCLKYNTIQGVWARLTDSK
jgi:hypothetical protein